MVVGFIVVVNVHVGVGKGVWPGVSNYGCGNDIPGLFAGGCGMSGGGGGSGGSGVVVGGNGSRGVGVAYAVDRADVCGVGEGGVDVGISVGVGDVLG